MVKLERYVRAFRVFKRILRENAVRTLITLITLITPIILITLITLNTTRGSPCLAQLLMAASRDWTLSHDRQPRHSGLQ